MNGRHYILSGASQNYDDEMMTMMIIHVIWMLHATIILPAATIAIVAATDTQQANFAWLVSI